MAKKMGTGNLVNLDIMRKAGSSTVAQTQHSVGFGLAKLAGNYVNNAFKKAKELKSKYPTGINIDKVPESIRPQLTEYLSDSKKRFSKAANIVAISPSWTKKYKNAVDEMNRIKLAYQNINNDLTTLQTNKDAAWKSDPGAGATEFEKARHYDLQNGDVDFYNIEFSDEGVFFTDYEEENDSMVAKRKPISQFGPAPVMDNTGSTGQDTLFTNVKNNARKGYKWDEAENINKINAFLDGMNETQLKNWMFNGNDSYGYHIVKSKLGHGMIEIEDDWTDEEIAVAKEKNEMFKVEMDLMKYSPNLKNQSLRDAVYDALKEAHDINLPSTSTTTTTVPELTEEEKIEQQEELQKTEAIDKATELFGSNELIEDPVGYRSDIQSVRPSFLRQGIITLPGEGLKLDNVQDLENIIERLENDAFAEKLNAHLTSIYPGNKPLNITTKILKRHYKKLLDRMKIQNAATAAGKTTNAYGGN